LVENRQRGAGILPERLVWKNKNGVAYEKNEDIFIRFDRVYTNVADGQTDRQNIMA